jgi:uncharacterized membrane protein
MPLLTVRYVKARCSPQCYVDPGERKTGRVLVDDSHGDWEPTHVPFDTERYDQRFSYSYSLLYKLLGWHYQVRRHESGNLTDQDLGQCDVLILKTPTEPFAEKELSAIERFVESGGGLFLIGDHTNLFGMTTYLNQVANRFGLSFASDDTFALETESLSSWSNSFWMSHPITANVPEFAFETSCTIQAPLRARTPMVGYGLGAEVGEYSKPGFFGNIHLDLQDDFGFFVQHAVIDFGRGRVAGFSDSTTFSNFSVFFPGRRELALSTVEYLNHTNSWASRLPALAIASFCILLVLLIRFQRGSRPVAVVGALMTGAIVGTATVQLASLHVSCPFSPNHVRKLLFDRQFSRLPLPSSLEPETEKNFDLIDTFILASQRLDYVPVFPHSTLESLPRVDCVVVTHPTRDLSPFEAESLTTFVAEGGNLLLLDGLVHTGSATNQILAPFGLSVDLSSSHHEVVETRPDDRTPEAVGEKPSKPAVRPAPVEKFGYSRPMMIVRGGHSILRDQSGHSVFSVAYFGKGRVAVFVDSTTFSKAALGTRFIGEPNQEQISNHKTAYKVLRTIVEGSGLAETQRKN